MSCISHCNRCSRPIRTAFADRETGDDLGCVGGANHHCSPLAGGLIGSVDSGCGRVAQGRDRRALLAGSTCSREALLEGDVVQAVDSGVGGRGMEVLSDCGEETGAQEWGEA